MAITRHHQTDVSTTATVIEGTQYPGFRLKNNGSNTVFLGDSTVTTATGFPVAAGAEFIPQEISHQSLRGKSQDRLYGIVAAGTEDVRVLVEARVNP